MLRNTTSRLESNRGHLQFNLYSRLATNQGRWGMAIFAKCLCTPSLGIQAYEFSCQSLFDFSRLKHKNILAEVRLEVKVEISCSTSPPGGNQVDGLPPALNKEKQYLLSHSGINT